MTTVKKASCESVKAPAPRAAKDLAKPKLKLNPAKQYVATVETSCGSFQIRLDAKSSPITGGSFLTLAKQGFYDGLSFHRIASGFVIQGGDPAGDGSGGPGYTVRERPRASATYEQGVVAMAKTGADPPGTSGSQFFVVTGADAGLPPEYAILGKVSSGLDTVMRIEALGQPGADGPPTRPVVIKSIKIAVS